MVLACWRVSGVSELLSSNREVGGVSAAPAAAGCQGSVATSLLSHRGDAAGPWIPL